MSVVNMFDPCGCTAGWSYWEHRLGSEDFYGNLFVTANYVRSLAMQGKYAQAGPLYERSLAIWDKSLAPQHPAMAATLHNWAEMLKSQVGAVGIMGRRGPEVPG